MRRFRDDVMAKVRVGRRVDATRHHGRNVGGRTPKLDMDRVLEAERLGFSQVWTGEAYSTDAVTPVAWILARTTKIKAGTGIMQIPARTPACAAMTVMSLQALSGNRFLCGVGVVRSAGGGRLARRAVRQADARARRNTSRSSGRSWRARSRWNSTARNTRIPYDGPDATGLGKPLRSIAHGDPDVPFYIASITPAGLRTAGEVRRRRLPIFYSPEQPEVVTGPMLEGTQEGRARADAGRLRRRPLCPRQDGSRRGGVPRCDPAGTGAVYRRHGRAVEELLQRCRDRSWATRARRRRSRTCISTARRPRPPPRCRTS